jgi:hypothetical protein
MTAAICQMYSPFQAADMRIDKKSPTVHKPCTLNTYAKMNLLDYKFVGLINSTGDHVYGAEDVK